jgi:hypothetical protein
MNKEAIGKTPTFSSAFVFVVESVFCEKNIFFSCFKCFFFKLDHFNVIILKISLTEYFKK